MTEGSGALLLCFVKEWFIGGVSSEETMDMLTHNIVLTFVADFYQDRKWWVAKSFALCELLLVPSL